MVYCISDIHGCYIEFMKLLDKIQLRKDDIVYVLGDVVDRREEAIMCLKYIKNSSNIHLLMGNHEKMMIDALKVGGDCFDNWIKYYGGDKTIEEFRRLSEDEQQELLEYIIELPYYLETEVGGRKFIMVHAGIDISEDEKDYPADYIMKKQKKNNLIWVRESFYQRKGIPGYIIVFGHTSAYCLYGKKCNDKVWIDPIFKDKIGIDLGCHKGGGLMALRLDDLKEFYVCQEKLDEKGLSIISVC